MTPEQEQLALALREARERWATVSGQHFPEHVKNEAYFAWSCARDRYLDACEAGGWDCSEALS